MKTTTSCIEILEARIAPAGLVNVDAATKTATWADVDQDTVTLKWTGANAPTFADHFIPGAIFFETIVDTITFTNPNDAITVTVKANAITEGDGHVDLGYIDATGVALKSFTAPKASVLEFDAGDTGHAIGSLSIGSYGTLPSTAFSSPGGNGTGALKGIVGTVKITGDLDYGILSLGTDGFSVSPATIGSVTIGGSLHGDVSQGGPAGVLLFGGPAGAVKIGGSVIGGSDMNSGQILVGVSAKSISIAHNVVGGSVTGAGLVGEPTGLTIEQSALIQIGSISVGGSVIGGAASQTGLVDGGVVNSLVIGGDVQGGSGSGSGAVATGGDSGSITVKGSVRGGSGEVSGVVVFYAAIKSVNIGRDVVGGSAQYAGLVSPNPTAVNPNGDQVVTTTIVVGGSVIGGSAIQTGLVIGEKTTSLVIGGDVEGGSADNSGEVGAVGPIGSIVVKGSVIGGQVLNPISETAVGDVVALEGAGSISIGRDVIAGSTTHTDAGTTHITKNGAVLVNGTLGSLSIGGSIEGNNATRAFILGEGTTPTKAGNFNGIGKLTVKGSVNYAVIASGQDFTGDFSSNMGTAEHPDAGIGSVSIGGDYYHSSLMAGTNDLDKIGVGRTTAGVSNDTQSKSDLTRTAILGPVTIKGALLDDTDAAGYSGFESEQIAKIVVGGATVFKHSDLSAQQTVFGRIKFFDAGHFILAEEILTT